MVCVVDLVVGCSNVTMFQCTGKYVSSGAPHWLEMPDIGQKSQKIKSMYNFCFWMFHKTNGTNEKVVPQGFILALKKIHFYHLPPQN